MNTTVIDCIKCDDCGDFTTEWDWSDEGWRFCPKCLENQPWQDPVADRGDWECHNARNC
jgi:formylmethanofuran dehydrogenase subunit E